MRCHKTIGLWLLLAGALLGCDKPATEQEPPLHQDERVSVRINPRSPQQIAAFYHGRGFPQAMVDVLKQQCFITVSIHNKSQDVLWLELDNWRFSGQQGNIARRTRAWWNEQWQAMDAPLASQSTFRWTLLPERLDFQPDEAEGGNVILPRTGETFDIEARFLPAADKKGAPLTVRFQHVRCAEDSP